MAKDTPEQQANSTNVLLAQILNVLQDTQKTNVAALAVSNQTLQAMQALLKVQVDSKDFLEEIANSISGGGDEGHTYTVRVLQVNGKKKK